MEQTNNNNLVIRPSESSDLAALKLLYPAAFPDEDLLALLQDLLAEDTGVFSFVATHNDIVVGHIAFTLCGVAGEAAKVALLAPLAVRPDVQQQGIGSALVHEGLQQMKREGACQVNVLGDPAYYGRFGFEADNGVAPPYDIPPEWRPAWQVVRFDGSKKPLVGALSVPAPWRNPKLWGP